MKIKKGDVVEIWSEDEQLRKDIGLYVGKGPYGHEVEWMQHESGGRFGKYVRRFKGEIFIIPRAKSLGQTRKGLMVAIRT
jgi:hypothetical protein